MRVLIDPANESGFAIVARVDQPDLLVLAEPRLRAIPASTQAGLARLKRRPMVLPVVVEV